MRKQWKTIYRAFDLPYSNSNSALDHSTISTETIRTPLLSHRSIAVASQLGVGEMVSYRQRLCRRCRDNLLLRSLVSASALFVVVVMAYYFGRGQPVPAWVGCYVVLIAAVSMRFRSSLVSFRFVSSRFVSPKECFYHTERTQGTFRWLLLFFSRLHPPPRVSNQQEIG
jgi:hypothetical protein